MTTSLPAVDYQARDAAVDVRIRLREPHTCTRQKFLFPLLSRSCIPVPPPVYFSPAAAMRTMPSSRPCLALKSHTLHALCVCVYTEDCVCTRVPLLVDFNLALRSAPNLVLDVIRLVAFLDFSNEWNIHLPSRRLKIGLRRRESPPSLLG